MDRSEWVRVPRVPSDEMVDCALRLLPNLPRVCMTVALEDAIAAAPPPPAEQASGEILADLELVWHSVSDDRETNAAYERLKAALSQRPVVDEAMVERACRGICAKHGWNADAPVTYARSRRQVRNKDGATVPQWQMHEVDARAALTAALAPQQPTGEEG